MADKIAYEILEDGTISIKTEGVSQQNHVSADQLLKELALACGGQRTERRRLDIPLSVKGHIHTHADGTTHSH